MVPQFAVATFALVFLVDQHGLAAITAGLLLAVAQACGAASRLGAGAWSDRVGSRLRPMRLLALAIALIVAALAAGAATRAPWAIGALLVAVVLAVSTNGLSFTAVAEHAGSSWAGRALGVQNTGQNAFAAATPPALAAVIGAAGLPGRVRHRGAVPAGRGGPAAGTRGTREQGAGRGGGGARWALIRCCPAMHHRVQDVRGDAVTMTEQAPVSAVDPFSDEFLADPFRWHGELREAGPVVWLERYGIWAMARYAEVHEALRDWATYCSSAGVGLSDFRKEKPWRPPSLLLEADPPEHDRARKAVARALSPRTIRELRGEFAEQAGQLAADLVARGTVDGVADIAEAFPLRVFGAAVGLPEPGGEPLLAYGNMAFNAFGPRNELTRQSLRQAAEVGAWIAERCRRDALRPGSLGARIYASADDGTITEAEAALLVRSLLTAGVDTTVIGLGCALDCLARDPAQWQLLRADPALAGPAFEESLRYASPVQTFFRTTTRQVTVGGVTIGAGEKVLLFLAAANRDPRRWDQPDRFDLRRRANGHVAFGFGIHACVGAAMARLEGEELLAALARRARWLAPAGPPRRRLNNTLSGFAALPLSLRP